MKTKFSGQNKHQESKLSRVVSAAVDDAGSNLQSKIINGTSGNNSNSVNHSTSRETEVQGQEQVIGF